MLASAPRGATGRADLPRAVAHRDHLALDVDASSWFGYVRQIEEPPRKTETEPIAAPRTEAAPAATSDRKLPLRLPFLHLIVQREPRRPPEAGREAAAAHADPFDEDEDSARAPSAVRLVGYEDLVPGARLLPALRRALGATRAGPLDLDRLTQDLATQELPRRLPRRRLQRWHPELVVLLDFCPRLWPYRWDMHRLAERLLRQCGRSGVSLHIVNDGPFGPWSDWVAHQDRRSGAEPPLRPWAMPLAGTPVLIVSDLASCSGRDRRRAGAGPVSSPIWCAPRCGPWRWRRSPRGSSTRRSGGRCPSCAGAPTRVRGRIERMAPGCPCPKASTIFWPWWPRRAAWIRPSYAPCAASTRGPRSMRGSKARCGAMPMSSRASAPSSGPGPARRISTASPSVCRTSMRA